MCFRFEGIAPWYSWFVLPKDCHYYKGDQDDPFIIVCFYETREGETVIESIRKCYSLAEFDSQSIFFG